MCFMRRCSSLRPAWKKRGLRADDHAKYMSPGMNVSPVWPPAAPFQWCPGFVPPGEIMYEVKMKNLFREQEGISTVLVW